MTILLLARLHIEENVQAAWKMISDKKKHIIAQLNDVRTYIEKLRHSDH